MASKLTMRVFSTLIALFSVVAKSREVSSPPHILFVVADDLGWSDVGFHGSKIQTPNIDKLASEGVVLDNYYVLPMCTPTRSALMTGRYPIHTGMQHFVLLPVSSYGLPLNFTILPQKLREVGYATHMVGKWHLGFNKWSYTPTYRGFDSFYGFYNAAQDHYTHKIMDILDFRDNEEPVRNLGGQYATFAFAKRAEEIIRAHKPSQSLFLYLAFQNVHLPVQVPKQYLDKYVGIIKDETRRNHAGMVDIMDEALGNVTEAMKEAGLWDDTLLVFTTDNGGIHDGGGYNWPLRGEKTTLWEGGVRGVSFVHGKMLDRKGVTCKDLLHVTDWYPTLVKLAGGTVDDDPSPLDGRNVWNTVSRGDPSPRTEILLNIDPHPTGELGFSFYEGIGLRYGDMKLLLGVNNGTWFKPPEEGGQPITARDRIPENDVTEEAKPSQGNDIIPVALFNVTADPEERNDLSDQLPTMVKALQERVQYYMKGVVPSLYGPVDQRALRKAQREGVWTPWQDEY